MRIRTGRLVPFALALLVVIAPACIFDTRDGAPPADDSGDIVVLDSPEKVFVAIERSLTNQKDANYERATSENFVFSPTPDDSLDQNFEGTQVYANWTKTVELNVLELLLSDAQTTQVTFEVGAPIINKTTFVRFPVDYTLRVVSVSSPGDTVDYKGLAEFDVRRENGIWRMTFWNETSTVEGASTWGFLKGILRLRLNP